MSYYNTTNETGQTLIDFTSKAKSQEEIILEFFTNNRMESFTWSEISNVFPNMNECSLKRSITNLKNDSKLIKTDEKGISKYGKPSYKYKLATWKFLNANA